MIDNFRADLIVQVNESEWSREAILKKMGYHKPSATNLERLQKVLNSPTLGLDVGGYDLRYQSHEFVHELCRALELPLDECDANIARIKRQAEDDRAAFKPYLWVDTDFKRKDQRVFVLAFLESRRYLGLPRWILRLTPEQQLVQAQELVQEHMRETEGELLIWGTIKRYWFFYAPNRSYWLAPDGEIIAKNEGAVSNRAGSPVIEAMNKALS
jgi:hypothetical protein